MPLKLNDKELLHVIGGTFTASLVNSIVDAGQFILELGRVIGSAIRRTVTGKCCDFE